MPKKLYLAAILLLACCLVVHIQAVPTVTVEDEIEEDEQAQGSYVETLTSSSMSRVTAGKGLWLVKFYAPWCGHCKALAPVWEDVAREVTSEEVHLAEINCDEDKALCSYYDVHGFPTIKLFRQGFVSAYRGGRTKQDIKNYIAKKMSPPLTEVSEAAELEKIMKKQPVVFVALSAGGEDNEVREFLESAAYKYDDYAPFVHTTRLNALSAIKGLDLATVEPPSLYVVYGKSLVSYEGEFSQDAILRWVSDHRFPPVVELTRENFREVMEEGGRRMLIVSALPEDKKHIYSLLDPIASKHPDFIMTFLPTNSISNKFIESIGHETGAGWPYVAVVDGRNQIHYVGGRLSTSQLIEEFLDNVISGKIEAQGEGKNVFTKIMRTVERTLSPLLSSLSTNPTMFSITIGLMLLSCFFLWR